MNASRHACYAEGQAMCRATSATSQMVGLGDTGSVGAVAHTWTELGDPVGAVINVYAYPKFIIQL